MKSWFRPSLPVDVAILAPMDPPPDLGIEVEEEDVSQFATLTSDGNPPPPPPSDSELVVCLNQIDEFDKARHPAIKLVRALQALVAKN